MRYIIPSVIADFKQRTRQQSFMVTCDGGFNITVFAFARC